MKNKKEIYKELEIIRKEIIKLDKEHGRKIKVLINKENELLDKLEKNERKEWKW